MYDYAVVTDASQSGVRVRRRDKESLVKLTWRLVRLLYHFATQATGVQTRWKEALPELAGRQNWERLFDPSRLQRASYALGSAPQRFLISTRGCRMRAISSRSWGWVAM